MSYLTKEAEDLAEQLARARAEIATLRQCVADDIDTIASVSHSVTRHISKEREACCQLVADALKNSASRCSPAEAFAVEHELLRLDIAIRARWTT